MASMLVALTFTLAAYASAEVPAASAHTVDHSTHGWSLLQAGAVSKVKKVVVEDLDELPQAKHPSERCFSWAVGLAGAVALWRLGAGFGVGSAGPGAKQTSQGARGVFFQWSGSSVPAQAAHAAEAAQAEGADEGTEAVDWAALRAAAQGKNLSALELLLQQAPPRAEDPFGVSLLHLAALGGSLSMAERLMELGVSAAVADVWDDTPLHYAARTGQVEVAKALLARGARLDIPNANDRTPLLVSADENQEAVCDLLLEAGAKLTGLSADEIPPLVQALLTKRLFADLAARPKASDVEATGGSDEDEHGCHYGCVSEDGGFQVGEESDDWN